jgi:peptidoglycan hydrolase-like protein with peptidoglycan-binding domain
MRRIFSLAVTCAFLALTWAAIPATPQKAPARKPAAKSSAKKTGKKAPVRRATTWRNRQMVPTPARFREIQGALAAKGYLPAEEATGAWGPASIDALKRFQASQNIAATGKINSLSLIALGLGPKRDAIVKPPPHPVAQ